MKDAQPTVFLRSDYQPPAFLIDHVALDVTLDPSDTHIRSTLALRRNPEAPRQEDLVLDGADLTLHSVSLDGSVLSADAFVVDDASLTVRGVPDAFTLEVRTACDPSANTALEGLYISGGNFCTQCEAEGFRRITYYLDRPDVMATFSVRIEANQEQYPTLLSNGNPVDAGELPDGRHFATWEDPFKKPSYLFALVAGQLARREDTFTTMSGRKVTLHVYVEEDDLPRTAHCMDSLKASMKWDEETYGREYDLDLFQIVAVSDFNGGAMENKGLNIFNTKFVLADADTATDADFLRVQGVVGHEYFHNWSGNRVTCRDWFQLSLKEGFTVFRDQEFTADVGARAVKRIEDVQRLRASQFPEDAGPTAHPVRPDSYAEIQNFYTVTVYEKGAEVVRMLRTLLGPVAFRKGADLYFDRHDGQAVTCDDFVRALEDASGVDLEQFRLWYAQAGTPRVHARYAFDEAAGEFTITLSQAVPDTPGQRDKKPMHIPIAVGLLDDDGADLPLRLVGEDAAGEHQRVLELRQEEQSWTFTGLSNRPVPSLLRGFSAPVRLSEEVTESDLSLRMARDSDAFARWDAAQTLSMRLLVAAVPRAAKGETPHASDAFLAAFERALGQADADPALLALALRLPAEQLIAEELDEVNPEAIFHARQWLLSTAAKASAATLRARYDAGASSAPYSLDSASVGRRMLRNLCLSYLVALPDEATDAPDGGYDLVQFRASTNMTDKLAALAQLTHREDDARDEAMSAFFDQYQHDPLTLDKWFAVQAVSRRADVIDQLERLRGHSAFDAKNPNKVRSLLTTFATLNPLRFHDASGRGYRFVADRVLETDRFNAQLAARMMPPLSRFSRLEPGRRALLRAEVERIMGSEGLSRDVAEMASKALAG